MKTIIIYASKYGSGEDIANKIKQGLPQDTICVKVDDAQDIDLNRYEQVILGSSIYVGRINKKLKKYVDTNLQTLLNKRVAFFISRGIKEPAIEALLQQNLPNLVSHFYCIKDLGGELRRDRMGFMERKIVGVMSKQKDWKEPSIDEKEIQDFITVLNQE